MDEPLIVKVLQSYFPDWEPPVDRGREWVSALCPFHGDERPSASVSFKNNAFACHACGEKGNAIGIIMRREEISYSEAISYAEELSPGSSSNLSQESRRKPRRRVFGEPGTAPTGDRAIQTGVRRRPPPWA